MAPSKDTTMSASIIPLVRNLKRKNRADIPRSANDTVSVPAVPTKSVKATNGTNGNHDTNGSNGTSTVKESNTTSELITSQTVLNVEFDELKSTAHKTEVLTRKFDCVKHVRPAEFPEALGALPFPSELRGMVAWTDAFVERLGWMSLQVEQKSAGKDFALRQTNKRIEEFELKIQSLKTINHGFVDENHKLRSQVTQLTSRNKFLEGQHTREHAQLDGFKKTIASQRTEIIASSQENEKLRASVKSLEAVVEKLIAQHVGDEASRKALADNFEKWKFDDKLHDEKVAKLVDDLTRDLGIERDAKSKVDSELAAAVAKLAHLQAEKEGLETLRERLEELVKSIREKLALAEVAFGVSEGQKAALEALVRELEKKEESFKLEIHGLHGQLQDAKIDIENIKQKVINANSHAKDHWNTLEKIRRDGSWLRTEKVDVCDEVFVMQPICALPASKHVDAPMTTIVVPETDSN
ncbi:hypothetical protein N7478_001306 [Penicillium angulare]|uniref:uncharacterized protein n=1 Tax=Penicillium angulare TaxID=116970 RepID=UPI00254087AF|nr:uncharacterized protein N7478_001306 [Penicillium angulare]KAJ5292055.1 hypothetical protein N7478_001306 [Penicillium angulare]